MINLPFSYVLYLFFLRRLFIFIIISNYIDSFLTYVATARACAVCLSLIESSYDFNLRHVFCLMHTWIDALLLWDEFMLFLHPTVGFISMFIHFLCVASTMYMSHLLCVLYYTKTLPTSKSIIWSCCFLYCDITLVGKQYNYCLSYSLFLFRSHHFRPCCRNISVFMEEITSRYNSATLT